MQFITTENGTFCKATRLSDGEVCIGTEITWDMVKSEGWLDKSGSKWKTMPEQMFNYRAAAFWARKFCPELLMGIPTADEVKDVHGNEDEIQKETVVITLEDNNI